eukprot:TRINITY_DN778_c0_g1_i1.p1 TRINITY_DN778_c0_g1~~TRINITY_DN778_c0_g1_i1.p1  ORF type:complete len:406 (-),score=98.05 TRINITY_DN778_c0_g1_i1:57-1274(-)
MNKIVSANVIQPQKLLPKKGAPLPPPLPSSKYHRKLSTHFEGLESVYEFDFNESSPASIDNLDWSKAIGFSGSEGGSEGVYFVQFEDKSAIVLKCSSTVIADMFAQEISNFGDISTPTFRVVKMGVDEEFDTIKSTFERLDEKNALGLRGMYKKSLDRPIVMVMEFLKGDDLEHIGKEALFGKNPNLLSKKGKEILFDIGRMSSYDVLINNWDRIPLMWSNEGNAGNIMFISDKKRNVHPIAIDNSLTCIDPTLTENYLEYLDKVKTIFNEIADFFSHKPIFLGVRTKFEIILGTPSIFNVRTFFQKTMDYDMNENSLEQFLLGFLTGASTFSKMTRSNLTQIKEEIENSTKECLDNCKGTLELFGMGKVHLDFLEGVLEVYREALPTVEKILSQNRPHVGKPKN